MLRAILLILTAILLTACSGGSDDNAAAPSVAPANPIVDAQNWSSIELDARINRFDGKTQIDSAGHFLAAHNNCSHEDVSGAYSLDFWNHLATMMNTVMKAPLTGSPQCFDSPFTDTMIDGKIIVTTESGKVTLYEPQGNQTCTKIQDPQLAQQLFQTLTQALSTAGAEDCDHPI